MKCTKIYNARAQLLFSSLNLLFGDVLVAVVVVVCLHALLWVQNFDFLAIRLRARVFYEQVVNEAQPSWLSLVEYEGE